MSFRERFAQWLCPTHQIVVTKVFDRVHTYGVLDKAVLAEVTRRCNANTVVNQTSTELTVAYQLGIAHALNVLAKDFTVETQ